VSGSPLLSPGTVQDAIDHAAHFNLYATPRPGADSVPIADRSGRLVGFAIDQLLHRFAVTVRPPTARTPLTARNLVGEPVARLTHRWMVMAENDVPGADRDPQPTPIDPARSQRFVMLDTICTMANGEDGFRGFGTGMTTPAVVGSQPELRAMAVGTIIEGFGRFKGHEEGTYVYCGRLSLQAGFTGNVLLRLIDRGETFRTAAALPAISARGTVERDVTYVVFRGQAVPADPVNPWIGADGRPKGLVVEQGLRLLELDAVGRNRPASTETVGPLIGRITAKVTFNPAAPGGSNDNPIPFTAEDEFVFQDPESGRRVGSFTADSTEGRVFRTELLGQPGIRFGGVGRILGGEGVFKGIQGLMTDNSVVAFEPHVSASVYVLRIDDPSGLFSWRVDPEESRPFRREGR
jgi:hypothetical protein